MIVVEDVREKWKGSVADWVNFDRGLMTACSSDSDVADELG